MGQEISKLTGGNKEGDLSFYEKIIEPSYLKIFKQDNNPTKILPPDIKVDLDKDPTLDYLSKKDRLPRIHKELEAYNLFVHNGQRKLFMSELQHLTAKLSHKNQVAIVIYAGAAPCNKLWMEHLMFPNVKFLLVDPAMFNIYLKNHRDSHYAHTDEKIVYYVHSKTNHIASYGTPKTKCAIRYFDGKDERVIPNKYAFDDKPTLGDKHIRHFYESDNRIFICEDYFTNTTAEFCKKLFDQRQNYPEYKDCKVLFWSDVRTNENDEYPPGGIIAWNTAMMFNWLKICEPEFAMLKFRTPYEIEDYPEYEIHKDDFTLATKLGNNIRKTLDTQNGLSFFKGEIYHQTWNGRVSTETRLWVNGEDIRNNNLAVYDCAKYEKTIFYYNCIRRTSMVHENKYADKSIGFDHCGDCAIEATIWGAYKKLDPEFDISAAVVWMGKITGRNLLRAGHGGLFPIIKGGSSEEYHIIENMADDRMIVECNDETCILKKRQIPAESVVKHTKKIKMGTEDELFNEYRFCKKIDNMPANHQKHFCRMIDAWVEKEGNVYYYITIFEYPGDIPDGLPDDTIQQILEKYGYYLDQIDLDDFGIADGQVKLFEYKNIKEV